LKTVPIYADTTGPWVPSADRADPIDLVHLRRYTLGNRALEKEVLQLFSEQAVASLDQLRAPQTPQMRRLAAHTLKGSARAVGAVAVARCAEHAERSRDAADRDGDGIAALEAAVADACRFVAAFAAESA
jgi:HPt (histidine-containing phosphotransfer) domain-containing protein